MVPRVASLLIANVPIVLAVIGSTYLGYVQGPYSMIVVWSVINTGFYLYWSRSSFDSAFNRGQATRARPGHWFGRATFLLVVLIAWAVILAAQTGLYYLGLFI
jgi:hypothetical protein